MKRRLALRRDLFPAIESRPMLFVALVMVAWSGPMVYVARMTRPSLAALWIHEGVMAALAVLVLARLHLWRDVGFRPPSHPARLLVALGPALLAVVAYRGVAMHGAGRIALYLGIALLGAFQSEVWHRGVILRALVPRLGTERAVVVSALLFGAVPLLNILVGAAPGAMLVTAAGWGLIGYIFAALRLYTGCLWPGIIVRWLVEVTYQLGTGGHGPVSPAQPAFRLVVQGLLMIGLFLMARYLLLRQRREV